MLPEGSFPLSNLGPGAGQQAEVLLRSQARQGGVHGTGRVDNILRGSTLYMEQLECPIFSEGVQYTLYTVPQNGTIIVHTIFRGCTLYMNRYSAQYCQGVCNAMYYCTLYSVHQTWNRCQVECTILSGSVQCTLYMNG